MTPATEGIRRWCSNVISIQRALCIEHANRGDNVESIVRWYHHKKPINGFSPVWIFNNFEFTVYAEHCADRWNVKHDRVIKTWCNTTCWPVSIPSTLTIPSTRIITRWRITATECVRTIIIICDDGLCWSISDSTYSTIYPLGCRKILGKKVRRVKSQ